MDESARAHIEAAIRREADAGNYDAATTLAVQGFGPELFRFVVSALRDRNAADDVFAEACADIWRGLPGFAWQSTFRTWAFMVARRACYRHLRAPARRRKALETSASLDLAVAAVRTNTRPYLLTETKSELARLRDTLAPEDRVLLNLRIDRALEWPAIAEVLADEPLDAAGIQRAAAAHRKRFERLTHKLRELAREAGLLKEPD